MGEATRPTSYGGLRVLIAGGGVAGLEAMLALRDLAGDLVDIELLSPEPHFWYRPISVAQPFDPSRAYRFELSGIAAAVGAGFTPGDLSAVDNDAHLVKTSQGVEIAYDVLVIACGTSPGPGLAGALTFRGPSDTEAFRSLLAEIEAGVVKRIAFVLPKRAGWSLPLYELALLTATYLEERAIEDVELSLVTHEPAPLRLLGQAAGEAVASLLDERGITLQTGHYPVSFEQGRLELVPEASLFVDRVVALARLEGRPIGGVPADGEGFIGTDRSGRVYELTDVYAAGDITRFPIKQGGIAAQQADAVAEAIAAKAGADVTPEPREPVLYALLLTGKAPLYLRAALGTGHGDSSVVANEPLWWPAAKIAGRYLAPFLATHEKLD
jgi:sulfide:quinone oxidoreductase